MSSKSSAPRAGRRTRSVPLVAVVIALAAAGVVGILAHESLGAFSSSAASPLDTGSLDAAVPLSTALQVRSDEGLPTRVPGSGGRAVGTTDGKVPDGVTIFDDHYAAVTRLDPSLLGALRDAATDAKGDGITLFVNSGWRSRTYQEELFAEAVTKYGSQAQAARWVARPGTSVHEAGKAVDIGGSAADAWLAAHGAAYGLCQIYRNEAWHYELRLRAIDDGCPAMYADPTHDPRMQQ